MLAKLLQHTSWANPSRARVGPIGMQCALREVHMVQMSVDEQGQVSLLARASERLATTVTTPVEHREVVVAAIKHALASQPFKGRDVVSCMPQNQTRMFPISFTVGKSGSESAAIVNVVADRVEGALSDYVMDFMPVRRDQSEEQMGIVALARQDDVEAYLDLLASCGLTPKKLETGPLAVRRLLGAIGPKDAYANVIAINFGQRASYISVVSGRRLLLDQALNMGEESLLKRVGQTLDTPADELRDTIARHGLYPVDPAFEETAATIREIIKPTLLELVEEINRTLIYIASQTRGEPVKKLYLLGSVARWTGIERLLNSLIRLEVEIIANPLKQFTHGGAELTTPEIAIATGLALSSLVEDE